MGVCVLLLLRRNLTPRCAPKLAAEGTSNCTFTFCVLVDVGMRSCVFERSPVPAKVAMVWLSALSLLKSIQASR